MCLDKILDEKPPKTGIGYKVYEKDSIKTQGGGTYVRSIFWLGCLEIGKWHDARNTEIHFTDQSGYRRTYISGFHIFPTLKDAKSFLQKMMNSLAIYRIEYRKGHLLGEQFGLKCIVADKMIVLEEVEEVEKEKPTDLV